MNHDTIPRSIDLRPDRLRVEWADGVHDLAVAPLRAACRCGGCRSGRVAPDPSLALAGVAPAGEYGVQLVFSDGHDRGIYPWEWLRRIAEGRA